MNVKDGKIIGTGVASMDDIIKTKVTRTPRMEELTEADKATMERIKIRVEYLESQLAGGDCKAGVADGNGFTGPPPVAYTDAEKESMRRELGGLKAELAALTKRARESGLRRPELPFRPESIFPR